MKKRQVRLEASDVPWKELTPDQIAAGERAVALLTSFADQPPAESRPDADATVKREHGPWYLPWIDGIRANPVVLLDGGRGSGKTTVLFTLLRAWSQERRNKQLTGSGPFDRAIPPAIHPNRDNGVVPGDERFLPLDVIDLQPIPRDTSLLLRVSGVFLRIVEHLEHRARQAELGKQQRARRAWDQLVRVVASGWEPNMGARKGSLDLESYAVELGTAEQRGRDIQIAFRAFIDALLFDLTGRSADVQSPLLIVPIDDGDMNVPRSVELITLLRTLWHPRVAFLLTGFSQMFLLALRAHFLGESRRPLRHLQTTKEELEALHEPEMPLQFAEQLYNRVIPPFHRCRIEAMPLELRLDSTATGRGSRSGSIRSLLGSFVVGGGPGARTLATYFTDHPALAEALPERLRSIEDVRLRLTEYQGNKTAAEVALYLLLVALDQSALVPNEEDRVHELVKLTDAKRPGSSDKAENHGPRLLVFGGEFEMIWEYRVLHRVTFVPGVALDLLLPLDLPKIRVSTGKTGFDLPPSVAAALLLVLDVVADGGGSLVGASPLIRNPLRLVEARLTAPAFSWLPSFAWRLPEWESPRDFAIAARAWSDSWLGEAGASSREPRPEMVLRSFVHAAMAPVDHDAPPAASLGETLRALASRAVKTSRDEAHRTWARESVGLLRYPEAGLAGNALDQLESTLAETYVDEHDTNLKLGDPAVLDQARIDARSRQLSAVRPKLSPAEAHEMAAEVCRDLDRLRGGLVSLEQRLRALRVVHPMGSFLGTPNHQLAKYLVNRDDLLAQLTREERQALEPVLAPFSARAGVASAAIVAAWSALARLHQRNDIARAVQITADGLDMDEAKIKIDDRASVVASVGAGDERSNTNTSVILRFRIVQLDVSMKDGRALPPSMDLMYRIAADLAADENDLNNVDPVRQTPKKDIGEDEAASRTWPGVLIDLPDLHVSARWPGIAWRAPLDRELVRRTWNDCVVGASEELAKSVGDDTLTDTVDALAFHYVQAMRSIGEERRPAPFPWSSGRPTPEAWREVLREYYTPRRPVPHGRRWSAFQTFTSSLVLFAAPEMGLSAAAAEAILAAAVDHYALPVDEASIQRARRACAHNTGMDLIGGAEDAVRRIDEIYAGHPFVNLFSARA